MDDTLNFEIDSRIIAQTILCKSCHRCVNDPGFQLCNIDFVAADGAILFVLSDQCIDCSYKATLGTGTVCGCPIRKEIMAKYQI
jgi:hypothetical protein